MLVYSLNWLLSPLHFMFVFKKYYLHEGELWLLIYTILMLISTAFGSWIMQLTYLILVTALSMKILSISKQTNSFISDSKVNFFTKILLQLDEQLSIIVYCLASWILLRSYTTKSLQYKTNNQQKSEQNNFQGLLETLQGWNCTQLQFVIFPLIWIFLNSMSYYMAKIIMKIQVKQDTLYKEYILKYKIIPDLILSLIVFLYNIYSFYQSNRLTDCQGYWQSGYVMHLALYLGFPLTTTYFFYVKNGVFMVQAQQPTDNLSDRADTDIKEQKIEIEMKMIK